MSTNICFQMSFTFAYTDYKSGWEGTLCSNLMIFLFLGTVNAPLKGYWGSKKGQKLIQYDVNWPKNVENYSNKCLALELQSLGRCAQKIATEIVKTLVNPKIPFDELRQSTQSCIVTDEGSVYET